MPDTGPVPPADASAAPARVPARAWLRPALMLVGGALAALLFVQVDQQLAAFAVGVFSLFMAYWTSPLRSGPHTPLAEAQAREADDTAPTDRKSTRLNSSHKDTSRMPSSA